MKLKVQLTAALVVAIVLAFLLFMALQSIGTNLLDRHFGEPTFIAQQNQKMIAGLSEYVSQNRLSIHDDKQLNDWSGKKKYVTMYIYRDKKLVYSSDGYYMQAEAANDEPFVSDESLYNVSFTDADAQVFIESFAEYRYYTMVTFASLAVAFAFFLCVVLLLINVKTSYIEVLENEIKLLEGGNLEYPITIKGKDELSSLAQSINEMRKSFIERLENEELARKANNELVTAMSHDLRTPLTALIGYLDIIQYRKYKSDEQLFKYIANSKDNAYRIKHLSDQLFEYFLVSYSQNDLPELDDYDGLPLLDQMIGTHVPLLIDEGFEFEFIPCDRPFTLNIHVISMQRVFDNLFSNILKYADKSEAVTIMCTLQEKWLYMHVKNRIKQGIDHTDSNSIGIKVCEKIVQNHGGSFDVVRTENIYSVQVSLPVG
ncbi:HAMP domain-containing sensor histidine kinase [Saccharibacillus sacchari]|uniref:HAMP domain-containing sensor histidine kinase n=1 Tax=Saccharibacillus sacchari TaxID=456493 RepID=A0ACC6P687_9BACL